MRIGGSVSMPGKVFHDWGQTTVSNAIGGGERIVGHRVGIVAERTVNGVEREQVRPHLESGQLKVGRLLESVAEEEDPELREFYDERVEKLETWMRRGRMVLPLLQKVLGQ